MLKNYYLVIVSLDFNPENLTEIKSAVESIDEIYLEENSWDADIGTIRFASDCAIEDGTTEEEFATEVVKAIWIANKQYCPVEVAIFHQNREEDYFKR